GGDEYDGGGASSQGGFWYGEGGGASALEAAMGQWGGDLIHLDTGGDTEETDDDSSAHGLFIAQGNSEQAIAADDAAGDGLAGRRVTAAEGQRVGDDAAAVSGGGVDAVGECDGRNDELESWEIVDAPLEYWEGFPTPSLTGTGPGGAAEGSGSKSDSQSDSYSEYLAAAEAEKMDQLMAAEAEEEEAREAEALARGGTTGAGAAGAGAGVRYYGGGGRYYAAPPPSVGGGAGARRVSGAG
ncbi:unnamed protein product, partial [Sphacelaria rigidula]